MWNTLQGGGKAEHFGSETAKHKNARARNPRAATPAPLYSFACHLAAESDRGCSHDTFDVLRVRVHGFASLTGGRCFLKCLPAFRRVSIPVFSHESRTVVARRHEEAHLAGEATPVFARCGGEERRRDHGAEITRWSHG